jgi:ubiquinol-cytochrome c reductase cytochrome b subunit
MERGAHVKGVDPVAFVDERVGKAGMVPAALRYVFPEHWSFLLGEMALYSFMVLVATGVYLALFFEPSLRDTVYQGPYEPLQGREMSVAYASALQLSFEVKAGLLMRQTHHWAANLFLVAIALHFMRIFFTGAFRKPREPTYVIGLTMLALGIVEGYLGYSLLDDLLSGMGLAIGYAVVLSVPFVGGNLGLLVWGGEYPGAEEFISRMYIAHVLLIPVAIAGLIALHLLLVTLTKHGQFREGPKTETNVIGTPLWPGYALRSIGFALAVAAVLFLLGGLVQINPIWLWGPYETWLSTNGAQPDWYAGWLIGALRLMPGFDLTIGGYTVVPNVFWPGLLFPVALFGFLYLYPLIERRLARDRAYHHLLDRPRDAPVRTGLGWAILTLVAVVLLAGSADRVTVQTWLSYEAQLWFWRVGTIALPVLAFLAARRICRELKASEQHPLLGEEGPPSSDGRVPPGALEPSGGGDQQTASGKMP